MNIAVVGLGYWGPNLVRNFIATKGVDCVSCFDLDSERLKFVQQRFPSIKVFSTLDEVLNSDTDAVVVATPVSTHFPIGKKVLEAGKHLFLEKPMATTVAECEELIGIAERKNVVLMVDHTFLYTGAVRKIKEIVSKGLAGDVYYFDSVRVNLGLFQHDVNVLWDLAPHDLSIMNYILGRRPTAIAAMGVNHINGVEDVAYLTVQFDEGLIAHFHVNWLAPVKIRRILIGGSKQMIVYDDMEPSEKVKVYDKGVEVTTRDGIYSTLVQYRTGDMFAPKLEDSEALSLLAKEFVCCIQSKRKPLSDGAAGLEVIRILEASEVSLRNGGRVVKV
jgi:predicted dehydrogenase